MATWHCTKCDVNWVGDPPCWSCGSDKHLEPPTPPPVVYGCFGTPMSAPG